MSDKKNTFGENSKTKWLVIAVFISVIFLVVIFIFLNEYNIASREEVTREQKQFTQPAMLSKMRAREDSLLTTYGVIDSTAGVYRIPVNRAMELIAEQTDNLGNE